MRGRFITFEGGEGTGKSTQAQALVAALKDTVPVVLTREPGGTPFAEEVRNFLLLRPGSSQPGTPLAEALLFFSARADHVERLVRPALAAGTWVVCDRFTDSTRAYQGAAGGVPDATLRAVEKAVLGDLAPDLTFVLDLPAEAGLARADTRRHSSARPGTLPAERDLFETRDLAFHRRLREGFLAIASGEPARCEVIDAARSIEEIRDRIWTVVRQRLGPL